MPELEFQPDDGEDRKLEPPKLPPGDPKLALGLPTPPRPPPLGGLAWDSVTTKTANNETVKKAMTRRTADSHIPLVRPRQNRFGIG